MSVVEARFARVQALIAQQPLAAGEPVGVAGRLQRLCGAAARGLSAAGVGLSVMAEDGVRGVTAASDGASERMEELQFTLGEGPCMDAFSSRRPVLVSDLAGDAMTRWPAYAAAAHDGGVRAAFAFPLQVGAARLGVLDVFRAQPGGLTADHLAEALTFVDVAVVTLLYGQEMAPVGEAAHGLEDALSRRAELFQAQGMVMVQLGVSLEEALVRMRAYAYAECRPLREVASDVVARRLRFDEGPR